MNNSLKFLLLMVVIMTNPPGGNADEPLPTPTGIITNLKLPTLGGVQFWTDLRWWHGWRIQQNKLTGHCRLLDPSNVRHCYGPREACEAKFADIIRDRQWPEPPDHVVVCLHGLMRTHRSFISLGKRIESETSARAIHFGYASTRAPVSSHAQALRGLIEGLPGKPRIDIVGHSMGNIIVRHAIADWQRDGDPADVLPRLGRLVMQGPPNQGAQVAKRLQSMNLFEIITGRSGMQLGAAWDELQDHLATPPCEFGIIAGSFEGRFRNPLIEGASDLIVSVEESKLSGANDFIVVPVLHAFLMNNRKVQELTIRFLSTGAFAEDGQRNPLP